MIIIWDVFLEFQCVGENITEYVYECSDDNENKHWE